MQTMQAMMGDYGAGGCPMAGGQGHMGTPGQQGMPMVHKIYEPAHHGAAAFQLAVNSGNRAHHWQFGDMAQGPGLSPDDVARITAYVRLP